MSCLNDWHLIPLQNLYQSWSFPPGLFTKRLFFMFYLYLHIFIKKKKVYISTIFFTHHFSFSAVAAPDFYYFIYFIFYFNLLFYGWGLWLIFTTFLTGWKWGGGRLEPPSGRKIPHAPSLVQSLVLCTSGSFHFRLNYLHFLLTSNLGWHPTSTKGNALFVKMWHIKDSVNIWCHCAQSTF